jgi:phenylacetate-CoA ligase
MKTQWWTRERLEEMQLEALQKILAHARQNCAFYKDLPVIKDIDDLKQIPILTKKHVHDSFEELSAKNVEFIQKWTGGTSEQVVIRTNKDQTPFGWIQSRYHSWQPKGTWKRQAVIWGGGELHHVKPRKLIGNHLLFGSHEVYQFPIEWMTNEETTLDYLNKMKGFKPTSIRGYASSLRALAYYAIKHGIKFPTLKCVINNCEPISKDIRDIVRKAFGVEIFDFYGSQDLGSMGAECNKHEGLHLSEERYILEVMPDGRYIWTDLMNYAMPLIRYENGDIGGLSDKMCSCNRGLRLLSKVVGRTLQYLWTKQGDWMNMTEINEAMYYDVPNYLTLIEAHQVQQDEQGKIRLLLKAWDMKKLPDMSIIQKYFADRLDVEVTYVDEMTRSKSGKQLACITKFRPPWLNKNEWEIDGTEKRADV